MNKIVINNEFLVYEIKERIEIIEISSETLLEKLLIRLLLITNYYKKDYFNKTEYDLKKYNFIDNVLLFNLFTIKRFMIIGNYETGKLNNICDIKGLQVGHKTIHNYPYHTGVTVIKPVEDNIFKNKCVASSYAFNGFGKSIGFLQVEELGTLESNIALTTTLNVGKIANAVVEDSLKENLEIAESTGTVNPIVLECNDGTLNKSRDLILSSIDYFSALNNVDTIFNQGDVGAGSGMICHGFKGGIGSSSRIIKINDEEYHLGILVNSNFGEANGKELILNNKPLGQLIKLKDEKCEEKGSIVCVIATDAPINERQIKRILKRVEMGIARTGSYAGNGSGDVFIGFSTANRRKHFTDIAVNDIKYLSDNYLNSFFKATIDVTIEAIINSMLFSSPVKGYKKDVKSLMEYHELFDELLDGEILWKQKKKDIN